MSHEEKDPEMDVDESKKRQNKDKTPTSQKRQPNKTREEPSERTEEVAEEPRRERFGRSNFIVICDLSQ